MKLLKNKKGFDWAFLIVGVVMLCLIFLFMQLDKKMDVFDISIGQMQMDLVDKLQKSENLLFYLDQSGRLAACDAIYKLGKKGGFYQPPCGETPSIPAPGGVESASFTYWYKDGRKCYEHVNFYKEFTKEFNAELTSHTNMYNSVTDESVFLMDNHEFMITDNKVVGSAIKNIDLEFVATSGDIGIGKYSFKPSFALDFKTGISDYFDKIAPAVDDLIACRAPMPECVKSINTPGLTWSHRALGPAHLLTVEQNINCRFTGPKPKILIAIETPPAVPEVTPPPVPTPPIPPIPVI